MPRTDSALDARRRADPRHSTHAAPFPDDDLLRIARSLDPGAPAMLGYDGTLEGLLASIFVAYAAPCEVTDVCAGAIVQPRIGQQVATVPTSFDAAERVARSIRRACGPAVWRTVMAASAADGPQTGTCVYRFVRYALDASNARVCSSCKRKRSCNTACGRLASVRLLDQWAHPDVGPVLELQRRVSNEVEKMRQFVRFSHVEGDLWFARCNPNCSVVPLVMAWFAQRYNTQRFVIYDEVHHIAGISEGGRWELVSTTDIAPLPPAQDEALMQQAWKRFYRALSIDERYNPELRDRFMPHRLWRNLTEMKPE